MQIKFWASTDVGRVREHNEDNFLVDKRLKLFVVCDGMGGHAAGEVASAIGVRTVRDTISAQRDVLERLNQNPSDVPTRREVLQLIERAIHDANAQVYSSAMEDESRRGMGTTCSLLLLTQGRGFVAHVGDSRVYLLRNHQVHQMTEDHSLYNEMVRLGKIKPGEQINLPNKNAVTRAVGVRDYVEVDVREFEVQPGDRFLTCSDGLSGYFKSDEQLVGMISNGEVRGVTERFIEFAVGAGGKDNITAIVVEIENEGEEDEDAEKVAEVISQTPYFQYLSAKEFGEVRKLLRKSEFADGAELFDASEEGTDLHIVLHGCVHLERNGEIFRSLLPGEHLGEVSFIDSQPNDFRAVAHGASTVLILERARFMKLLRDKPALAVKLLWNFLQMFSIKLRQVPAEIVFTPMLDELDDDVLEEVDATPSPGALVIPEGLVESSRPSPPPTPPPTPAAVSPIAPTAPITFSSPSTDAPVRMVIGDVPVGLGEPTAPHDEEEESEEDLRQTVEFSRMTGAETSPLLVQPSMPAVPPGPPPAPEPVTPEPAPRPARATTPLGRGISGESFSGVAAASLESAFESDAETGAFDKLEMPSPSEVSEARRDAPRAAVMRNRKKLKLGGEDSSASSKRDEDLVSTVQLSVDEIQNHMVTGRTTVTQSIDREQVEEQIREDSSSSISVEINFDD